MVRRIIFLGMLTTVLGCSGVSSLWVVNRTDETMIVQIIAPNATKTKHKVATIEQASANSKLLAWYGTPPPYIQVVVTDPKGGVREHRWTPETYPPSMTEGPSASNLSCLEINLGELKLRDATFWEEVHFNPLPRIISLTVFLLPTAMLVVILVTIRRGWKRAQ